MTDKELLQQALDELLFSQPFVRTKLEAIEAIKARLAQPELLSEKSNGALSQEENKRHNKMILEKFYEENADLYKAQPEPDPVAWRHWIWKTNLGLVPEENDIPLYTSPQKKEWVGLTDEERLLLWNGIECDLECLKPAQYARAIEAKLKEKNT